MSKKSNTSKRYTAEFKRDAVALALSSDKTVTEVARDLGVSPEGLRGWVKQAKVDRGEGPAGALTSAEREELAQLRRKVRELEKTVDILGKVPMTPLRVATVAG
ncbi:transposase [Streptomyces sp. NBC_01728]|uniref:transposase n=1 Tax=unclassified Streptomyces TaxID=2593676 RepID=UPI0022536353|nr:MULTISPECIES: transposase [unclassified Streptomyces]MCX4460008.1 transposase [Streptomyces sp. NBC_01719]MCX4461654.1 transposase [Streptomyces sp. NBC_01719]MCX4490563.1 transposase [Streptomyces sp. NBC_01728]MCX4499367.1 transposase [Streptomyces sp. NBC_01728]